jgi:GTP-binding protein
MVPFLIRPDEVVDELLDLFIELGANDDQLEFKVVFASATHGTSSLSSDITTQRETMNPILDLIVSEIPAPSVEKDGHLQFQGALLDYNEYVGRMAIGRIKKGTMRTNTMVSCMRLDGSIKSFPMINMSNNCYVSNFHFFS